MKADSFGLLIAFVFVLVTCVWQRFVPKIRIFYLCLVVSAAVVIGGGLVFHVDKDIEVNSFVSALFCLVLFPGWAIATFLVYPILAFDQFGPIIRLAFLFSEIIYAAVLFGIVMLVLYIKRRLSARKTSGV